MIKTVTDHTRSVTFHSCSGSLTADEIQAAIKAVYDAGPTRDNLWDLGDADISALSGADVAQLASFTRDVSGSRGPGRTAIVATKLAAFGISRMFQAYADVTRRPVELRVFKTRAEAEAWLASSHDKPPEG